MDFVFLLVSAVLAFSPTIMADNIAETYEKFYTADTNYIPIPGGKHQHNAMGISTVAKFSMLSNTPTLFKVKRPGLQNDANTVSFESIQKPGFYLRYKNYKFHMEEHKETDLFHKDATFRERLGPRGRAYELLGRDNWFVCHSDNTPYTLEAKLEQIGTKDFVDNCVYVPARQKAVEKKNIVKTEPNGGAMLVKSVPSTQTTDKCISLRFINKLGGPVRVVSSMKPEGYLVTANAFKLKTIFKHARLKQRRVIFYAENVQDRDDDVLLNTKSVFTIKPENCEAQFQDVVLSSEADETKMKDSVPQLESEGVMNAALKPRTTPNETPQPLAISGDTPKPPAMNEDVPKLPAMNEDVPKLPAMNEEVPKLPAMNGNFPKPPDMNKDFPKPPDMNKDFPKPPDMNKDFPKPPDMNEDFPKPPDMNKDFLKPPDMNKDFPKHPDMNEDFPKPPDMNKGFPKHPAMNEDFPKPPDMNEDFPKHPAMNKDFLKPPDMNEDFLKHPAMNKDFPKPPDMNKDVPMPPDMNKGFPMPPDMNEDFPKHPAMNEDFPKHPAMNEDFPKHPAMNEDFPKHPAMNEDVPKPPDMNKDFLMPPAMNEDFPKHPAMNEDFPKHPAYPAMNKHFPMSPDMNEDFPKHPAMNEDVPKHPAMNKDFPMSPDMNEDFPKHPAMNKDVPKHPAMNKAAMNKDVPMPPDMNEDVPNHPAMSVSGKLAKPPATKGDTSIPTAINDVAPRQPAYNNVTPPTSSGSPSINTLTTTHPASESAILSNPSSGNKAFSVNPSADYTVPLKQELHNLDSILQKRLKNTASSSPGGGVPWSSTGTDMTNGYSGWSSYSPCSVSCGVGYRRRTRICRPGMYCSEPTAETRACIKEQCSSNCIHTTGGTVRPGSCCHFPFTFNGAQYYHCILSPRNNERMWCATSPYYEQDKQWGFCPRSAKAPVRSVIKPVKSMVMPQRVKAYVATNSMPSQYSTYYNKDVYNNPYNTAYKDNSIPCNPMCARVCIRTCAQHCCLSTRNSVPYSAYIGNNYGPTDKRSSIQPYQAKLTPYQAKYTPYQAKYTPYQAKYTPYQAKYTPYQARYRRNLLKRNEKATKPRH